MSSIKGVDCNFGEIHITVPRARLGDSILSRYSLSTNGTQCLVQFLSRSEITECKKIVKSGTQKPCLKNRDYVSKSSHLRLKKDLETHHKRF